MEAPLTSEQVLSASPSNGLAAAIPISKKRKKGDSIHWGWDLLAGIMKAGTWEFEVS